MMKKNVAQHRFCIVKTYLVLTIAFVTFTASFFIPGIKSISAEDYSSILICIDPGHGGKDTGAIGPNGLLEKNVNLDIALKLRDKLGGAGFKVIMTREDDSSKSLDEIVNFANTNNADIFVSVHNNSHTLREKNGTEVFYFSESPGSNMLAKYINAGTVEQIGTLNRGIKNAGFRQIKNTIMPSVLVEAAFISNPDEEARLNDEGYRDRIATGIYNGIVEYLKNYGDSVFSNKKLASAQSFVKRVYQKSLNVDPDQAPISNWADRLAAGTISHADVIKDIILSKQFNGRNLSDAQYITVLYMAVLDRIPDSNGAAHWLVQLKAQGRKGVLNSFLASDEFKGLVNIYIKHGYSYTGTIDSNAAKTADARAIVSGSGTGLVLSILNGVGIKGIAARASGLFKELKNPDGTYKYNLYKVIDANNYNYKNTQIICKSQKPEILKAAEEVKVVLKVGVIAPQNGTSQYSDIVVIIGKDFSLPTDSTNTTTGSGDTSNLILVNILNGQGTQGIAAKAKSSLEAGFNESKNFIKVTEAKNADSFNYKDTRIIIFTDKTGINNVAEDLKKLLGKGEISKSSNNVDNVDITIILGSDY